MSVNYIDQYKNRDGQSRAYIKGTRIRVQDIVMDHEFHGLSPEEIAIEFPHITLAQVYAALSYYHDHREEIRTAINQDEKFVDELNLNASAS